MTRHRPGRWRLAARRDLAAVPPSVWAGIFVLDLLGLVAITAQVISLASNGSQAWASHLAWVLAGLAACVGTAAAGIRIRGNPVIRQTWLLYTSGPAAGPSAR